MRLSKKLLLVFLFLAAAFYLNIHAIVKVYGRPLLINKLTQAFRTEVTVGSFETSFPFNLHIKDLEARNVFKVKDVLAVGGVTDILRRSIVLSELRLDGVELLFEKNGSAADGNAGSVSAAQKPEEQAGQGKIYLPGLLLKKFVINNGTLRYIDKKVNPEGITLTLEELDVVIQNLNFPLRNPAPINFELTGRIPWKEGEQEGSISLRGWVNFLKKSAEASLKVENIDGVYLRPYYAQYVDLDKVRIEKAKLKFTSDISGVDNNLAAACQLELTDVVFKQPESEQDSKTAKFAAAVLDIFKTLNRDRIVLDFTVRTTMDNPEFGFGAIRDAVRNKIVESREPAIAAKDILLLPGRLVEGTMKGATDLSGAVIGGTFTVGKELGKAILGAFKKEGN